MQETTTHLSLEPTEKAMVAIVRCEKVGGREAQILETDMRKAASSRQWRMVIDLSDVTLLASMGLGLLVTMHKEASTNGGRVAICGLRPEIMQILKVTHLERVLKIHPDRQAALKAVS